MFGSVPRDFSIGHPIHVQSMTTNAHRQWLAAPLTLLASCASMMAGTESSIRVTSTPPGASVMTDSGLEVVAPCTVTLRNGDEVELTATHEAHPGEVRSFRSVPDLSRWSVGNIIMIGSVACMMSDVANPAAYVHKHDVHFDFTSSTQELAARELAERLARIQKHRSYGGTLK